MKRACITLDENSSIENLVNTLNKNKVVCVVVISSNTNYPVGIISERDLVRNYKIILNNTTYKPYTICQLADTRFGEVDENGDSYITEWFNFKGFTYVAE